jgi:sec-independent protein translocase protein TatA
MFAFALGPTHIMVLCLLGVLLFGKNLPEIGRSLGKAITEFKRGLHGVEEEVAGSLAHSAPAAMHLPARISSNGVPPGPVS